MRDAGVRKLLDPEALGIVRLAGPCVENPRI
jgi:hypothetical protein